MMSLKWTAASTLRTRTAGAARVGFNESVGLFVIGVVVLCSTVLTITPLPVGAFQDDAIYTVLAKAIAEGHGYRLVNLPGEPNATHYPPGYPLLLALLWKFAPDFPSNVVIFKFANAVLMSVAAWGCYRFVRRQLDGPVWCASLSALTGTLSITVLIVAGAILSEPLFMAMTFPTLVAAERVVESGKAKDSVIAGLWCGALTLVRSIGIAALIASVLVLAARRRWRSAIQVSLIGGLVLTPWQIWVQTFQSEIPGVLAGKYGSYGQWLIDGYATGGSGLVFAVMFANIQDILLALGYAILPIAQPLPRHVVLLGLLVLLCTGAWTVRKKAPVALLFLLLYLFVVVIWPFHPSRFLIAIWPFGLPLVVIGSLTFWNSSAALLRAPLRIVVAATVSVSTIGFAVYNGRGYKDQWWASIPLSAERRAGPIVKWASENTKPGDVLSTEDDLMVYLYANRKAVPTSTFTVSERKAPLTAEEDLGAVLEIFEHYKPSHFVVSSRQGIRTAESLSDSSYRVLKVLGSVGSARIYSRVTQ